MKTAQSPLKLRMALLGLGTLASAGCGPSIEAIGASALGQVVLCDVMLALFLVPFVRFWRRLRPELEPRWAPYWTVAAVHLAVALWAGTGSEGQVYLNLELVGIATSVMMPFYVAVSLLAVRVSFIRLMPAAFWLAPACVSLLMVLPALMMRSGEEGAIIAVAVWFWGGIVLLPLTLIGLIVELGRRFRAATPPR